MKNPDEHRGHTSESDEIREQAGVEVAMLLIIEQSLRIALQWTTRGRGSTHKLSTLRFHASSFERHLARIQILEDQGGCMSLITKANPHLANDVRTLREERGRLHAELEGINLRLERISPDDSDGFNLVCAKLESLLDDLRNHGEREGALLQHSFTQEEGGSG